MRHSRRPSFFKRTLVGLTVVASTFGTSGPCYLPNIPSHNVYYPNTEDLTTVISPEEPISEEEAFAEQTDKITASQSAFISSLEPDTIFAYAHPSILRVADADSPQGLCSALIQFQGLENYQNRTITKADLVLYLKSGSENQSSSILNVEIGNLLVPWNAENLSYNSADNLTREAITGFSISENYPGTTIRLDLTRIIVGRTQSGALVNIVQNWIDNPSENYGIRITPSFEHPTYDEFRTFYRTPDPTEKPTLEIKSTPYSEL